MYVVIEKSKNKKKQKKEKAKKEFMGMLNYPLASRAAAERLNRNFYREPIPTSWKYVMLWGIYTLRFKKKQSGVNCIITRLSWEQVLTPFLFYFRIRWVENCWGNSRLEIDGRNCGSCSQTSVFSSTKHTRYKCASIGKVYYSSTSIVLRKIHVHTYLCGFFMGGYLSDIGARQLKLSMYLSL